VWDGIGQANHFIDSENAYGMKLIARPLLFGSGEARTDRFWLKYGIGLNCRKRPIGGSQKPESALICCCWKSL
jgi:hypothetical protein